MDRILCSSPYIPREWIAAHRLEPYMVHPSDGCVHECVARIEGLCAYARGWISKALTEINVSGIILAQTCDQLRRAFEIVCAHTHVPCFLFNLPATWQTVQARLLFRDEIRRLSRFLVELGGREPSAQDLMEQMTKDQNDAAPEMILKQSGKIPLALAGPHGTAGDSVWLEVLAEADAGILVDCSKQMSPVFDRRAVGQDPFSELSDACFDAIHDVFQRPNSRFYQKLDRALQKREVKGLIVCRYLWCDLWHAEIHRLKQWSPVPVLDLEIGNSPRDERHRLATRIQSFVEMVQ
jgi:benzoyl-CoA reductase/2-hydroxyglutaryl-CoA dehydratase subunit BcrC/BadD/HgdB